ncbi:MAG: flavin reductase family protein [Calditrichia bacterium]
MHVTAEDIVSMEQRYRAHFVNSLSGFKSANLVGSVDNAGNNNLAIISSVFHLGANPPLIGMIIRPHTAPRGTFENILASGFYTINHVNADIFEKAHQTSARYRESVSEFREVGLTPESSKRHPAPYVQESRLKIGVFFCEHKTIELNGTNLIIGEIVEVLVDDSVVKEDGFIDIESLDTVAVSGLDRYHQTKALARLSYAKPHRNPERVD